MNQIQIKKTNWGIACRIGNVIYINKKLEEDKGLYDAILKHEREHTNNFSWKDVKMDLRNNNLKKLKRNYYSFILTHPKTLTEFLPFGIYNGKLVVNPLNLIVYGISLIMVGGFFILI